MSLPHTDDFQDDGESRYQFQILLDPSKKIDEWNWDNDFNDFLVYKDHKTNIPVPDEEDLFKRLDEELSRLFGKDYVHFRRSNGNPLSQVVYNCYRIEARKKFVTKLENAKESLEDMLQRSSSDKRKKEIKHRIRHVKKRIDEHKIGTEHAFLTEEEVKRFKKKHDVKFNVFEYTYIPVLMQLGEKYEEGLDILEKLGVPNVKTHRGFLKKTKQNFFDGWQKSFVPSASIYLLGYKEKALEDIIRRLPAITNGGLLYDINHPDLRKIVASREFQEAINDLSLPKKETSDLLVYMKNHYYTLEGLRNPFIRVARGFYRDQLQHKDKFLRWVAVRALADSYYVEEKNGEDRKPHKVIRREKGEKIREFSNRELDDIITALDIKSKYPLLAKHRSLLAYRLKNGAPYDFKGTDPYDLKTFESLIPLTRRVNDLLREYSVEPISLVDFCTSNAHSYSVNIPRFKEALIWMARNLGKREFKVMTDNLYFIRALNEYTLYNNLKERPNCISDYVNLVRKVSIKLEELAKTVSIKQVDKIYDCIFNSFSGVREGKEDYTLAFIELFADFNIKYEHDLRGYLSTMSMLAGEVSHLPDDKKANVFRNFRLRESLRERFGFADYITQKILDTEILSLNAKPETIETIIGEELFPTELLIQRYEKAEDKKVELELWKNKRKHISEGKFSVRDKLMADLEYTHFRQFANACMKKPSEVGYSEYIEMVSKKGKPISLPEDSLKEIDYLCIEANRLLRYLRQVKKKSEEVGKEVFVVSNYSYGVVAMLPIEDILKKESFRIINARIGSTECHNESDYVKQRLFLNGINKDILTKKPNIVVIDGTTHLQEDDKGLYGRYPDSHKGYVNYIAIINDILTDGKADEFARNIFRENYDIKHLRYSPDYEAAKEYITSQLDGNEVIKGTPYKVGFWNPGGLKLKIRRSRDSDYNFDAKSEDDLDASQPRMIIVNSTMPSSAMPKDLVERLGEHHPAYFDDHYEATAINFKITPIGVRYSNMLEEEIKKRYKEMFGEQK